MLRKKIVFFFWFYLILFLHQEETQFGQKKMSRMSNEKNTLVIVLNLDKKLSGLEIWLAILFIVSWCHICTSLLLCSLPSFRPAEKTWTAPQVKSTNYILTHRCFKSRKGLYIAVRKKMAAAQLFIFFNWFLTKD